MLVALKAEQMQKQMLLAWRRWRYLRWLLQLVQLA
jgi:hypothetical protein